MEVIVPLGLLPQGMRKRQRVDDTTLSPVDFESGQQLNEADL